MSNFCSKFGNLTLQYNPFSKNIEIMRCCIKRGQRNILNEISLEDFLKLENPYDYIAQFINFWPETFDRSVSPEYCEEAIECYSEKPLTFDKIEVSLQFYCNLKCRFCGVMFLKEQAIKNNEMAMLRNVYLKTLNSLKSHNFKNIRLTDYGEPLFFLQETKDFIKSLTLSDTEQLEITTNGTLIDDEFLSIIDKSPINFRIGISLNAWDRESYKEIMGGDFFDTVLENIKKLHKLQLSCLYVNFTYENDENLEKIKSFISNTIEPLGVGFHIQKAL